MFKVCIVEDDRAIAGMYEFKLEKEGFSVKVVHNGYDALPLLKDFTPDLVLLDLKMPHMSGDEMLERLRKEEWGANIRVVILTNISRNEAPQKLRFLNVDRYVVKAHHTPAQVVEIVEEILGKSSPKK